ncbi:ABC transporter substrate-binding protein [Nocardioides panacis]|uniref:ABC transporter substrate-binding protein n=1 Tax=Nocardioides panacis TaxID=2849501 RepID=A0A975SWH6_9ACTN|nr:ABC transporter substrate-binding protein [Nocardioides panacis]QWZ07111.1 ABC transporter substrate-binding protein [Nocardioides panacis]
MRHSHPRRLALLATAPVLALALAGCGGSSGTTSSGTTGGAAGGSSKPAAHVTKDAALAAKVPSAISSDGKITVGTDATYAPNEFLAQDGKTVIGFDVDLFDAVAAKLGLKATYVPTPFGSIIPGISSGKYEIGVSSFTINSDREKQANMVSYFSAGTLWGTKRGNPAKVDPNDACGAKVAVQKATVQADDVTARSAKCTSAGKPAIQIDQYQGQDQATAAVVSGKDQAMLADSPVIAYATIQTKGQLQLLGKVYDSAPYGMVVAKKDTAFSGAVRDAVASLIADGTYKKVLDSWHVGFGAIAKPQVNPPAAQ